MARIKTLILILIAFSAWHFIGIDLTSPEHISISLSSSTAMAQQNAGFATGVLNKTQLGDFGWFDGIYSFSQGLLNLILFLILVYVAFRNILNLGLDNYAIKKALPKIIFAAFFGNLVRPIVAVASRIVDYAITGSGVAMFQPPTTWSWFGSVDGLWELLGLGGGALAGGIIVLLLTGLNGAGFFLIVFGGVIFLFLTIGMLLITLFINIAPWIVLLAAAVGPLMVGLSALSETEGIYKKWLKILGFWLILPLILNVIYYLISIIPSIPYQEGDSFASTVISKIIPLILKVGLYAFAVRLPFAWEKDVGGLIASLPGTVAKTYGGGEAMLRKGVEATRPVIMKGRDWEHNLVKKARTRGETNAAASAAGTAQSRLNAVLAGGGTQEDQASFNQHRMSQYMEILRDERPQDRKALADLFNGRVSPAKMKELYTKYINGDISATSTNPKDKAAFEFFNRNKAESLMEASSEFSNTTQSQLVREAGRAAVGEMRDGKGPFGGSFKWARGMQKYTIGNFWVAHEMDREVRKGEMNKTAMRYDLLGHKVGGKLADLKSQTARKDDDLSRVKSTDKVVSQIGGTIEAAIAAKKREFAEKGQAITNELARKLVQAEFDEFDEAAESGFMYMSHWLGKKYKDDKGNDRVFDTNHLGTMIAGHNRLRDLAAQESRAVRDVEEMRFLREQRLGQAYAMSSPSAGVSAPRPATATAPVGAPSASQVDTNFVPLGTRQIREALGQINDSINRLNGSNALSGLRNAFQDTDLQGVTIEDYNSFLGENEGLAQEIRRAIEEKAGPDSADRFIGELQKSHGLETTRVMREAESFGDPQIVKMTEDYTRRQKMELVILQKKQETQSLQVSAGKLSAKSLEDPQVPVKVKGAIDTYLKKINGDQTVTPAQAYSAKQYLAAHAGLSDPETLTTPMVARLSRELKATTIRTPGER